METMPCLCNEEKIAAYARALAHPARVYILRFLEQHCACYAGDISEQLPIANSTVSQHLKVLREVGLIEGTFTPPHIQYCINKQNWEEARTLFVFFTPCC
ncbi:MAG: winged helix-turn-helix domain-containing protein [Saprospiraceae bacterium]